MGDVVLLFSMQKDGGAPASKFCIPQMVANTFGFGQAHDATVDIQLDIVNEKDSLHRIDDRNRLPFFPIIHHEHSMLKSLRYLAFATWLGIVLCFTFNVLAVTDSWIKGGDNLILFLFFNLSQIHLPKADNMFMYNTCKNIFPCNNLCSSWSTSFLSSMVQATLSCNGVKA
ncbi:hypothetical protein LXL04_039908 [Taraxacum kok-saghyz]